MDGNNVFAFGYLSKIAKAFINQAGFDLRFL